MLGNKQLPVAIDFILWKKYYGRPWLLAIVCFPALVMFGTTQGGGNESLMVHLSRMHVSRHFYTSKKLKVMQWSKTMFKITSQKCAFCFNCLKQSNNFVLLSISILFVLLAEKTLQMIQSLKQLLRMFSTHITTTHFYKTWSSNNTISD